MPKPDALRASKPCPMGDQFQAKAGFCTVCDRDLLEISAMTSEEVESALCEPQTLCSRLAATTSRPELYLL